MIADCSRMPPVRAFDRWDTRAWVRRCSPADVAAGDGAAFFPPELVPHLGHPAVQAAPPEQQRYLAAQHLYHWLHFTTHFEVSVVNRATVTMADGTCGVALPRRAALTAFEIYTDEGFHSRESLRVLRVVEHDARIEALLQQIATKPHIVGVIGPKGGAGKSTTALLLSLVLAQYPSARPVLCEVNPDWGTLSELLGRPITRTVVDVIRDYTAIDRQGIGLLQG